MNAPTDLLTAGEVAKILRVSRVSVYRWAEKGTLHPVRVGGVVRFRRSDVESLVAGNGDAA